MIVMFIYFLPCVAGMRLHSTPSCTSQSTIHSLFSQSYLSFLKTDVRSHLTTLLHIYSNLQVFLLSFSFVPHILLHTFPSLYLCHHLQSTCPGADLEGAKAGSDPPFIGAAVYLDSAALLRQSAVISRMSSQWHCPAEFLCGKS